MSQPTSKLDDEFIQRASIFRILTNSNVCIILLVAIVLLTVQFFYPFNEEYIMIITTVLDIGCLVALVFIVIAEYQTTILRINNENFIYIQSSSHKKSFSIAIDDIKEVRVENFGLMVRDQEGKVHFFDYISKPKNIASIVNLKIIEAKKKPIVDENKKNLSFDDTAPTQEK